MRDVLRRRQIVEFVQPFGLAEILCGEFVAQGIGNVGHFFHGELGVFEVARNLRIEIAADKAGKRDGQHAPESESGNIPEFKSGMEGDDDGGQSAEYDMKIEPVARIALAREPTPFFPEGIEIDEEERLRTRRA